MLFEPSSRSAEAQEHVSALIESTKDAEFPEDLDKGRGDKESLLDALKWLKKESIAQTGKKMADKLLPGNQYNSLSPAQFFAKIYRMRNNLMHRGVADRNKLSRIMSELERFVSDILLRQFNET